MHGATWIGLVHGRKRWALYEPGRATGIERGSPIYGSRQWFERVRPSLPLDRLPLECTQEPGEVMYLPGAWAHLTMNLGEAIGVGAQAIWNEAVEDPLLRKAADKGDPEAQVMVATRLPEREGLLAKAASWHPMAFSEKLLYAERLLMRASEVVPALGVKSQEVQSALRVVEEALAPLDQAVEGGELAPQMAAAVAARAARLYRSLGNALRDRAPLDWARAAAKRSLAFAPTAGGYAVAGAVARQLRRRREEESYLRACMELGQGGSLCRE